MNAKERQARRAERDAIDRAHKAKLMAYEGENPHHAEVLAYARTLNPSLWLEKRTLALHGELTPEQIKSIQAYAAPRGYTLDVGDVYTSLEPIRQEERKNTSSWGDPPQDDKKSHWL